MIRSTTRRVTTLLAVGVLALAGCTGDDEPTAQPSDEETVVSDGGEGSSYPTEGTNDDPGDEAEECDVTEGDDEIPQEAPKADEWPVVNGTGIPVSDEFGPTNRDGDVWTCFAHSPTGALFAATYIHGTIGLPEVRELYVSDNPGLEEGESSSEGADLRGFKFRGYDDSSASVELVYEVSSDGESALIAFPVNLYWENEQWVVHAADIESDEPEPVTGLTGYAEWGVGS